MPWLAPPLLPAVVSLSSTKLIINLDNVALQHRCGTSDTHRPPASRAGMQRPRLQPPARHNNRPSSRRRSSRRQATGRRALVLHMAHTVHRQADLRSSNPRRSSRRQATGSRALVLPMVRPQVSVAPMKSFAETPQVMHARPHPGQIEQIERAAICRFLVQHSNHEQGLTLGDSVLCPRNHPAALWSTSAWLPHADGLC
jgi:hypothetical protein